ncbi:MAG TPA: 23S rRNA (adenine(2503)-C(2))-methyltransferase RlmN [Acidimicrobiales bacterium]|nr:23S rRNA (adenine(2503)-C(2))-methyltransferase RlmN [Acidimicrobiales bacterium]
MQGPYDATRAQLAAALTGEPRYRVDQAWRALYVERAPLAEATALPARLRGALVAAFPPALSVAAERVTDAGSTRKWLFALADGATVETVLMAYDDRVTVCVSSQAGCAMGCTFCATGQAGFTRQLRLGEVLEQVARAAHAAAPRRLSNVVFMGMGEPLANYAVTVGALRRLRDEFGLSARHLTVSTVGVAPAIERLAGEGLPVTLALSLHAATDEKRAPLVPLNARYPIERLMVALERWIAATGRRVSFEWALIDAVNDNDVDADELSVLARRVGAHVNLIPLNPTPGYLVRGSPPARVREFRDRLVDAGVAASVRATRGRSIDAACGQLAAVTRGRRVRLRR